jgi:hypothetical protein
VILTLKILGGKAVNRLRFIFVVLIISCIALVQGCQHGMTSKSNKPVLSLNKVVVLGLFPAVTEKSEPATYQSHLTGGGPVTESVSPDAARKISLILDDMVAAQKGYKLVPYSQAIEKYSKIIASGRHTDAQADMAFKQVGKIFEADAVLAGYIYRWRERQGADYGVESPASVTLDLQLIRPMDGAILWKSVFDKTQQSLSENLLDMDTFIESGGKWMTAEKLAEIGIRKLVSEMP